jgi:hypothetical protein
MVLETMDEDLSDWKQFKVVKTLNTVENAT